MNVGLTVDLYPWFALMSSVLITGLFGAHALDSARGRVTFHDDRSAYELLISLTLLVASFGLCVSAAATFTGPDAVLRADMRTFGLGMVRGSLLVTSAVMLIADRSIARSAVRAR